MTFDFLDTPGRCFTEEQIKQMKEKGERIRKLAVETLVLKEKMPKDYLEKIKALQNKIA